MKSSPESGSVIIIAAVLLSVFIGFIALGIDGYRGYTAQVEKQYGADYAALSALTAYNSNTALTHAQRVGLAVAAAKQVSGENKISVADNQANFQSTDTMHIGPGSPTANDVGTIRFGRWWTEQPTTCSLTGCPCSFSASCFQECDTTQGCPDPEGIAASGYIPADAVSVQLKTKASQPIVTAFASLLGVNEMSVGAGGIAGGFGGSSIATLAAKHTVFVLDVSRFTTLESTSSSDNYNPVERDSSGREYAFRLTNTACPLLPSSWTVAAPFTSVWSGLSAARKSEYECVQVTNGSATEVYIVGNAGNTLPVAPKPHQNMVDVLQSALVRFSNQATGPGRLNRLSVLAIDDAIIRQRQWGFDTVANKGALVRIDNAEITQLMTALQTRSGRNQAFLFPRPGSGSDIALGLRTARNILKADSKFNSVENSVVLISNGLATCESRSTGSQVCLNLSQTANAQFTRHKSAMEEIYLDVATGLFQPDKIKLNVLFLGRDTAAHSVLVKRTVGPSGCMTDDELRNRNYMNVVSATEALDNTYFSNLGNGSFTNPKYARAAQYLYAAVGATQGIWGPIRIPCNSLSPGNWQVTFDARCASETTPPRSSPPTYLPEPMNTGAYNILDNTYGASIIDGLGRVLCDPRNPALSNSYPAYQTSEVDGYLDSILTPPASLLVE